MLALDKGIFGYTVPITISAGEVYVITPFLPLIVDVGVENKGPTTCHPF